MKPFQYKGTRRTKAPKPPALKKLTSPEKESEDPPIGIVQGVKPASKQEWYTALALDYLRIKYKFQVGINGARNIAGGIVLDFIADTAPMKTIIQVEGEYWHSQATEAQDAYEFAQVRNYYGESYRYLTVPADDIDTLKKAIAYYREELI